MGAENWACGIVCVGGLGVWDFLAGLQRASCALAGDEEIWGRN